MGVRFAFLTVQITYNSHFVIKSYLIKLKVKLKTVVCCLLLELLLLKLLLDHGVEGLGDLVPEHQEDIKSPPSTGYVKCTSDLLLYDFLSILTST